MNCYFFIYFTLNSCFFQFASVALVCVIGSIISIYTGVFVNVNGNDASKYYCHHIHHHSHHHNHLHHDDHDQFSASASLVSGYSGKWTTAPRTLWQVRMIILMTMTMTMTTTTPIMMMMMMTEWLKVVCDSNSISGKSRTMMAA